jgi:transketolase C-terminal domain/subunit
MFFKKRTLKKDEVKPVVPAAPDLDVLLKQLKRRYKNMVVVELGRSARHTFAQAVGYALVGKIPVVIGPASMIDEGWEVIRDNVVGSQLNVKFLVTSGQVDRFPEGEVIKVGSPTELEGVLRQMMESFGPACVLAYSEGT